MTSHPKAKKYLNKNGVYNPVLSELYRKNNAEKFKNQSLGVSKKDRILRKFEDIEKSAEILLTKIIFRDKIPNK